VIKLGYDTGYSGAKIDLPVADIFYAEQLGFDSVWASESYGSDAFVPLAYLASQTKTLRLGTGVAQLAARTPANFAMVVQTLDALAGKGRVVGGIGLSGPQIIEGWYGQPWGKPNARLRDYVAIVKKILRREAPVVHDGSEIALPYVGPGSSGLGKPLKSILHGNPDIPILLGTSKPANTRLAGEIADGWIAMHTPPAVLPTYLAILQQGLDKRTDGKTLKDLEIVTNITVTIADDVKAAFAKSKPALALYVGGMGAKDKNFHKDAMIERGFSEAADRVQELFMAGRKDEAAAAIPDDYIDGGGLIGSPARIKERFAPWRDAGYTTLRMSGPSREAMALMAELVRK
jgi:F420-dependent oxidoreductase-like protein